MTCRRRMKHPKRTLPPPHVALTHISSSLECEIKACAPSGGFGPPAPPLPSKHGLYDAVIPNRKQTETPKVCQ